MRSSIAVRNGGKYQRNADVDLSGNYGRHYIPDSRLADYGIAKENNVRFYKVISILCSLCRTAALTFPAIFTATGNIVTSVVGTMIALIFAFFDLGLIVVAIGAVAGALLAGLF